MHFVLPLGQRVCPAPGFPWLLPLVRQLTKSAPFLRRTETTECASDRPRHGRADYRQMSFYGRNSCYNKSLSEGILVGFPSRCCLPLSCVCTSSRQLGVIHRRPERNRKIPEDEEEKYHQLQHREKNTHLETPLGCI